MFLSYVTYVLQLKRRKEQGDSEMRKNIPVEEPKPPRETHKLLQVWDYFAVIF